MNVDESMLDVYIYESQQLLESLENTLFAGENDKRLNSEQINEVFRVVHTIKGASAMMEFENMTRLAHSLEDMFALIRESGANDDDWPAIFDFGFAAISFFNGELAKLLNKQPMDGVSTDIVKRLAEMVLKMKGGGALEASPPKEVPQALQAETEISAQSGEESYYKIKVFFEENSQMENIRAFGVVQSLKKVTSGYAHIPADLSGDTATEEIRAGGFIIYLKSGENPDKIREVLNGTLFLKSFVLLPIDGDDEDVPVSIRQVREQPVNEAVAETQQVKAQSEQTADAGSLESIAKQNFISVNVNKLDNLLNIVGEIVTAQSMVMSSADFVDGQHDNFDSAAQQLHNLINELQDIVMSIRMIPVSTLFQKMRRLVRDMSKKFGKSIELEIIGEETEVDKNVIDYLSDPLLHIIRNSVDHGIENSETRRLNGKPPTGKITLEARMTGSDVIVTIADDGGGLSREKILKKALDKGLITKTDAEMTDKEVFGLIFLPGFSTKEEVTEYSGRGVGMDVVRKNIGYIGGSVTVDSTPGAGTNAHHPHPADADHRRRHEVQHRKNEFHRSHSLRPFRRQAQRQGHLHGPGGQRDDDAPGQRLFARTPLPILQYRRCRHRSVRGHGHAHRLRGQGILHLLRSSGRRVPGGRQEAPQLPQALLHVAGRHRRLRDSRRRVNQPDYRRQQSVIRAFL